MFENFMGSPVFNYSSILMLLITVANWLLPMERFNKFIFRVKEEELDEEEWEQARFEFPSVIDFFYFFTISKDYARESPAIKEKAIHEYFKFVKTIETEKSEDKN